MMGRRVVLPTVVLLLAGVVSASAATFTVNTTADTYDGVCNAADCSLKDAIDAAVSTSAPDTVVLSNATYTVFTPFIFTDAVRQITNNVTVVGNGAVIERDPSATAFRLFEIQGGTLTLQNLTLRNGSSADGGAIKNGFGVLSVTDCVIESSVATQNHGGGIYHAGVGPLTITRSSIRGNTAQVSGGGLMAINFTNPAQVSIVDSAFIGNTVLDTNNGIGGGIAFSADVDATITSTTISGNSTGQIGGGIAFNSVPVGRVITILNTTIVQNNAGVAGGGLAAPQCTQNCPIITKPKLINTILANNTAGIPLAKNCSSTYDSGGNNILGPPVNQNANCSVVNQLNEIVLSGTLANIAALSTTGNPGGEHHELQAGNVGINNANPALCPATDQLGSTRIIVCERGAIEYRLPTPTINPCQRAKKKCVANKMESLLLCHAKAEKLGFAVDQLCLQDAFDKFTKCCNKAELKINCLTTGDCDALEAKVDAFVLDVVQELDPAYPTPVQNTCSSKKKKCVAKKAERLLKCHIKAEQTGTLSSKCLDKAHDSFDGGINPANGCFALLEAAGNCLTTGDTAPLEAKVDAFVDDVVCELDPATGTCGQPTPTPVATQTPTPTATSTPPPTPTATATPPVCQLPQPADCQCQDGVVCSSGCPSGSGFTCAGTQQGCVNLCTQFHGGPGTCPGACTDCATGLPCQ